METYRGKCHCGAIEVVYETAVSIERWAPRACQCSFCRKHGARTVTDARGVLSIHAIADALIRYRFARKSADFLLCARCGVYVGAALDDARATLNVRILDDAARVPDVEARVSYDDESDEARRARRMASWTPLRFVG